MRIRIACLAFLLALLMTACGLTQPETPTETTIPTVTQPTVTQPQVPFAVDYGMAGSDRYLPFVFSASDRELKNRLGKNGLRDLSQLTEGAFYVLDTAENRLLLLEEAGVSLLCQTPNAVFYVLNGRTVLQTNYPGTAVETLYTATQGEITCMERLNSRLFFTEGQSIVTLELTESQSEAAFPAPNVHSLETFTQDLLFWWDTADTVHILDLTAGESEPLSQMEYRFLRAALSTGPDDPTP